MKLSCELPRRWQSSGGLPTIIQPSRWYPLQSWISMSQQHGCPSPQRWRKAAAQGLKHLQALPRFSPLLPADHGKTIPTPWHVFLQKEHLYTLGRWGRCGVCKALWKWWKCQVSLWLLLETLQFPQAGSIQVRRALALAVFSRCWLL